MQPHFTNQVGAIGGAQTRCSEEVTNNRVRIIPISPSEKIGEFCRKAAPAQDAIADRVPMHKQDATVPQSRLLFFLLREISRNLITLRYGELPTPRFDRDLNAIELDNLDGLYTHARQAALGDGLGKGKMGSRPRRDAVDDPLGRQLLAVRQNGRSGGTDGPLRDRHHLSGDRVRRHKP
jgi:hypothetical protein